MDARRTLSRDEALELVRQYKLVISPRFFPFSLRDNIYFRNFALHSLRKMAGLRFSYAHKLVLTRRTRQTY